MVNFQFCGILSQHVRSECREGLRQCFNLRERSHLPYFLGILPNLHHEDATVDVFVLDEVGVHLLVDTDDWVVQAGEGAAFGEVIVFVDDLDFASVITADDYLFLDEHCFDGVAGFPDGWFGDVFHEILGFAGFFAGLVVICHC